MEKDDVLTRAFDALEKMAASFGQTAAEYWPQWVNRCVLAGWLKFGMFLGLTLVLVGVGYKLMKAAQLLDKEKESHRDSWGDIHKGGETHWIFACVCYVLAVIFLVPTLIMGYAAVLLAAYPEIEAAGILLEMIGR
jgi:hypothetical protein